MIKNQLKTVALLTLLSVILLFVGQMVGGMQGLTIALVFAVGMNFFSYWFSHKIVLMMYRAKEADKKTHKHLYKMVEEVKDLAGIPMPKVYIVPSENPNAFATGRNPNNAVVAVTEGLMKLLNDEELKGVIAHEMGHIKNRDILIQTIAATIAAVISYVAMMARWSALFGFGGRDRDGGNILELLVLAIVMPLVAMIIQLAISRSREYLADETAAKTLNNSKGLASALQKLESGIKQNPMRLGNKSTSCLFIANPFSARGLYAFLSTHPAVSERVKKLNGMKF